MAKSIFTLLREGGAQGPVPQETNLPPNDYYAPPEGAQEGHLRVRPGNRINSEVREQAVVGADGKMAYQRVPYVPVNAGGVPSALPQAPKTHNLLGEVEVPRSVTGAQHVKNSNPSLGDGTRTKQATPVLSPTQHYRTPSGIPLQRSEPMWLNKYPMLNPDDIHGLEQDAAINEFGKQMPRQDAEAQAHDAYVKKNRLSAAAHHFNAMKSHQASGDLETAKKHGMMYELHLKELGLDPYAPVPNEILHAASQEPIKGRFRPHPADALILHKKEEILADLMKDEGNVLPFRAPEGPNPDLGRNAEVRPLLNQDYSHLLPKGVQGISLRVQPHQGQPNAILFHNEKPVLRGSMGPAGFQLGSFETDEEMMRRRLSGGPNPSHTYSFYNPYVEKAFNHFQANRNLPPADFEADDQERVRDVANEEEHELQGVPTVSHIHPNAHGEVRSISEENQRPPDVH